MLTLADTTLDLLFAPGGESSLHRLSGEATLPFLRTNFGVVDFGYFRRWWPIVQLLDKLIDFLFAALRLALDLHFLASLF